MQSTSDLDCPIDTRTFYHTTVALLASRNIVDTVREIIGHDTKVADLRDIGNIQSDQRGHQSSLVRGNRSYAYRYHNASKSHSNIYESSIHDKKKNIVAYEDICWSVFKKYEKSHRRKDTMPSERYGTQSGISSELLQLAIVETSIISNVDYLDNELGRFYDILDDEEIIINWIYFWEILKAIYNCESLISIANKLKENTAVNAKSQQVSASNMSSNNRVKSQVPFQQDGNTLPSDNAHQVNHTIQSSQIMLPKINSMNGISPSVDVAQVDDTLYKKSIVHDAILRTVRKDHRLGTKLGQYNELSQEPDNPSRASTTASRQRRIRYSRSSQFADSDEFEGNTIKNANISQNIVPGLYMNEKPPRYALPTEANKINSFINPNESYRHRWKMRKTKYDENKIVEKKKTKNEEMLKELRQLVNMTERSSIKIIMSNNREEFLKNNRIKRYDTMSSERNSASNVKLWKENDIARKQIEAEMMRQSINSSVEGSISLEEETIKKISENRHVLKRSLTSTVIGDAPIFESKELQKIYKQNILSERISSHAQSKVKSILRAAGKADCVIRINPLRGEDYFEDNSMQLSASLVMSPVNIEASNQVFGDDISEFSPPVCDKDANYALNLYMNRKSEIELFDDEI